MSSRGYIGKVAHVTREATAVQSDAAVETKWGEIPGEILSYDAATQTASIRPLYKIPFAGAEIQPPDLDEVPVRFSRAGFGGLTFPIQIGDKVTLRPQMRSTDRWHTEGQYLHDDDARYNALSDMEAHMAGGEPLTEPMQSVDAGNTHLRFSEDGNYGIRGNNSGEIRQTANRFALEGNSGELVDLMAQLCEKLAADIDTGGDTMGFAGDYGTIGTKLRSMQL